MNIQTIYEDCILWIEDYFSQVSTLMAAMGVSALIDIRKKKNMLYIITGAMICGIVALAISLMLRILELPQNAGAAFGAAIGFMGADQLRKIAILIILRRTRLKKS